ncbi:MAG: hypothetical protein F6K00_27740 [Leptolyngbya sp. SIOISBB]|nr:hypothetical protein [Leptolyngbya sp. SIOISBB]
MVIVIPLEITQRLMNVARSQQLNLPIPLSSTCAGYLSQEEMDMILATLSPLHNENLVTATLLDDLQHYQKQKQHNAVIPCA